MILAAKFSLKNVEELSNVGPEMCGSKNTRQLQIDMREGMKDISVLVNTVMRFQVV